LNAPVLLATTVPEQDDRLLVVRRGDLARSVWARVPRSEWSIQRAAVSPGRGELLVGGAGGFVSLAAIGADTLALSTRKLHPFAVTGLGFSTDGEWVATAGGAGDMRLFRRSSFERRSAFADRLLQFGNISKLMAFLTFNRFKGEYAVRDFALSVAPLRRGEARRADVSVVALTDSGRALLWNHPGPFGKQIGNLEGMSLGTFTAIATNPASQEVWMTGGFGVQRLGGSSRQPGICFGPLLTEVVPESALAWNAQGTRLAIGFRDGTIRVMTKTAPGGCDGLSTMLLIAAHSTAITTLTWQGDLLASGASDGAARLWTMPRTADEQTLLDDVEALAKQGASAAGTVAVDPSITSVLDRLAQRAQTIATRRAP
jgi:WD40 repeat protein